MLKFVLTQVLTLYNIESGFKTSLFFNNLSTSTGTSVLDNIYEPIIAKITDIARGINKYFVEPSIKNIGANTVQIDNVETNAIIWGSGLGREWSRIHGRPIICAVRGKYTLRNLPDCYDKTKIAIGDPALLLPLIIPSPNIQISHTVGIIPHFMDYEKNIKS